MSSGGERPLDLGNIKDPPTPPSSAADPLTAKEIKQAKPRPARPSPSDRHAASVDRHIDDICHERERLDSQNTELHEKIGKLQEQGATLDKELGRMARGRRQRPVCQRLATVTIGVGGLLVSAASYSVYKTQLLWFGIASFVIGVLILVSNTIRGGIYAGVSSGADVGDEPAA